MADLGEDFFMEAAGADPSPSAPPSPSPQPSAPPSAVATNGSPGSSAPSPSPSGNLGEAFFEEAAGAGASGAPTAPAPNGDGTQGGSLTLPTGIDDATIDPGTLGQAGAAAALGAAKGLFAAKDFFATGAGLWADPPTEQNRSSLRQEVDAQSLANSKNDGPAYDLTEGLAQGAIGLLGAGKIAWGGAAVKAAVGAVGSVAAFEPHAANFANLAQRIPGMDGPVTRFLASDPQDSTALGYIKNALTSIGVEGVAAALFTGTAATLKAVAGGGDKAAIEAASADLEQALADHLAERQGSPASAAASATLKDGDATAHLSASLTEATAEDGLASPGPSSSSPPTSTSADSTGLAPSADDAGTLAPKPFAVDTDAIERMLGAWEEDEKALVKYGSWEAAIADGHTFGGGDKIPWQVLAGGGDGQPATSMDAFIARVSAGYAKLGDDLKGGAVQTDAANLQAVERRAALWNEDPSALLGALEAAGARAGSLRADMTAGFAIGQRSMQDTWALASRISIGDFSEWGGSRDAAVAALKQQTGIAATLLASAQSIRSNAARAMRGLRSDFALDPMMVRNLASLDGDALVKMLTATKGDPSALKVALQPGIFARLVDGAQLYLVNNLVSNPLTHAVIFGSNLWQATARPAMRAAGSLANGSFDTVGQEALRSYHFMLSSMPDAFKSAVEAFKAGDSILAPHSVTAAGGHGGAQAGTDLGQAIAQAQFGPWTSAGDVLRNTLLAGAKTLSFPTRAVGFQDELVKQVVYRGKVQAKAMVEGQAQGLAGDDLAQYVKGKLYDGFDSFGRATDGEALREAQTATYQNDLLPGTQGAKLQAYLQDNPVARVIIPFVRTPVNLFRQGVQLTPGLNLVQSEYRDAIRGIARPGETAALVAQRQAQAIGQMGMGTLIAGTAATLAYQGFITGNAPLDPKLAREAMQDGWRPNSIVIPHKDGSRTYVPFDRFDPAAMPLAMAADIINVLMSDAPADQHKVQSTTAALALTLYKALTDKLYLQHISQTLDFVMDPEKHGGAYLGGLAAGYVPASSALHLINADPVLREADDFVSAALGKVPGFSKDFPARRDWAGDPITAHKGLWSSTPADAANAEVERLALQQGASIGAPGSKARGGTDLRDITLAGNADPAGKGMSAYDRFQELAGHPERMPGGNKGATPLRQAVAQLVANPIYQRLADGAPDTPGTKSATLMSLIHGYREGARRFMASDTNVRQAEYAETMRVAKASGYASPNMPTATNTADGLIGRLGKMFGFGGLHTPSPAAPVTSSPPPGPRGQ